MSVQTPFHAPKSNHLLRIGIWVTVGRVLGEREMTEVTGETVEGNVTGWIGECKIGWIGKRKGVVIGIGTGGAWGGYGVGW